MNLNPTEFTEKIINWYKSSGRDLPWRKTNDPYCIWISEIMLQQTQVETVKPYYERFIQTFPTALSLAEAPLETVYKLWEGLGYCLSSASWQRRILINTTSSDCTVMLPMIGKNCLYRKNY